MHSNLWGPNKGENQRKNRNPISRFLCFLQIFKLSLHIKFTCFGYSMVWKMSYDSTTLESPSNKFSKNGIARSFLRFQTKQTAALHIQIPYELKNQKIIAMKTQISCRHVLLTFSCGLDAFLNDTSEVCINLNLEIVHFNVTNTIFTY